MTAAHDAIELLEVANGEFARRLRLVGPDDWRRSTPCSEWDVRALVNHVVGGNIRYQLLLRGAPTEEVEATRSVDHLGDDALAAFSATARATVTCFREPGALDRVGHHAMGDRSGRELLAMRILDAAVHGWDLARAISVDEMLDSDVVLFLLDYTTALEFNSLRAAFAAPPAASAGGASAQDVLLHRVGPPPAPTEEAP